MLIAGKVRLWVTLATPLKIQTLEDNKTPCDQR